MNYVENKMKSEFFVSNECIKFAKKMIATVSSNLVENVQKYNKNFCNDNQDMKHYMNAIKSDLEEIQTPLPKFKFHEISYGISFCGKLEVPKALYIIDLHDIINSYLQNPEIKAMIDQNYTSNDPNQLKSFFDGDFHKKQNVENLKVIYLSIYGDEINLANAIGNFLKFKCYNIKFNCKVHSNVIKKCSISMGKFSTCHLLNCHR